MWIRGFYAQKNPKKGPNPSGSGSGWSWNDPEGAKWPGRWPDLTQKVSSPSDLICPVQSWILCFQYHIWDTDPDRSRWNFNNPDGGKVPPRCPDRTQKVSSPSDLIYYVTVWTLCFTEHLSNPKDALIRIDPDHLSPNGLRRADLADLPACPENLKSVAAKLTRPEINQGLVT